MEQKSQKQLVSVSYTHLIWHTKIKRPFEKIVINKYLKKEGEKNEHLA